MKSKVFSIGVTIIVIITTIVVFRFYLKGNSASLNWIKDLNYEENQVHDMSIGFLNPCPSIPVMIGDKKMKLEFDTGNAEGIFITTAIKGKVDYDITGKSTELNADGTYRGNGTSILLKSVDVFGEKYSNVKSSLTDWRMYGFFKINGTIGLEYFKNKIVTLDYKNKKIAISDKPIDYNKLQNDKYTLLPLESLNTCNDKDLLFFQGEVNGKKSTIYLDTGSNRSFINLEDNNKATTVEVKLGDKKYKFKNLKHDKIGFKYKFEYPLRLAINSDLLKNNHFVITIDKIQNNLIIYQN
ncbi:hypothetical protein [Desnuesiella massiliensis]|uniref:hypothetical protein n=1 Tax=Desnuesiella massiliensis TaxID=1650662 RepID=UPI0006E23F28|nr:hypothetical protein [Desnuesiella massiliensis]